MTDTKTFYVAEDYRERCRPYWEKREGHPLSNEELEECIHRYWMSVDVTTLKPLPKSEGRA